MASFRESGGSRPVSQHRPTSTNPMNVPSRHSTSRNHTHSSSLGVLNPVHRVTRRKSMTSNNFAGVAAAVQGIDEAALEAMVSPSSKVFSSKQGHNTRRSESSSTARPGTSVPHSYSTVLHGGEDAGGKDTKEGPSLLDGHALNDDETNSSKIRNRRASEGAFLTKSDGKRASGELRCEKCGKGYKHSSCLTKHLWEHTPEWTYTSKLLISKHQQVQLLEAASVLVTMNQDAVDSDNSSASPEASGTSEIQDEVEDYSSVETTPPPISEQTSDIRDSKRYSSTSSVFSRSYQSIPGTSIAASSVPSSSYGSFHQSYGRRPSTSGTGYSGIPLEDEASLAAAVKLCSFGTPRSVATQVEDVPPVPPLPARYASHNASRSIGGSGFPYQQEFLPSPLSHRVSDERDVRMSDSDKKTDDEDEFDDQRSVSRGRSDEHDDGFFGRMEE